MWFLSAPSLLNLGAQSASAFLPSCPWWPRCKDICFTSSLFFLILTDLASFRPAVNRLSSISSVLQGMATMRGDCKGNSRRGSLGAPRKVSDPSSDLTQQQRIQNPRKENKCNICGKVFTNSSNLSRHRKIHSGRNPFKCTECGKGFMRGTDLTQHQRIHTGQKPYKCKVCDKAFNCSSSLTRHQRVHTEEKPYKCTDPAGNGRRDVRMRWGLQSQAIQGLQPGQGKRLRSLNFVVQKSTKNKL